MRQRVEDVIGIDGKRRVGLRWSGAVVATVGVGAFWIGPEIDPDVPALFVEGVKPLRLVLKNGNFDSSDFYERALAALEGQ